MSDKTNKDIIQSPELDLETRLTERTVGSFLAAKVMLELRGLQEPQAD